MHPLGCLPLWGREGVTLQMACKRKRITGNRISTEPKKSMNIFTEFFLPG